MLQESRAHGLLLDPDSDSREMNPDHAGAMHNPLWPFWWVLGWWSRRVPDGGLIHASIPARREVNPKFERECGRLFGGSVSVNETLTDKEIAELERMWSDA